jgi:hypothetical protein
VGVQQFSEILDGGQTLEEIGGPHARNNGDNKNNDMSDFE